MAEFVKLKKELVNGRYRNIYTKKNGKRQYVKSDGNYVLLSVFNKKSKKPSKTNKPLTQHRNPTRGGGYTDADLCIAEIKHQKCLVCPISKEIIKPNNIYILRGIAYDINSLYDTDTKKTFHYIKASTLERFDIEVTFNKNNNDKWNQFYYMFKSKFDEWNSLRNKFIGELNVILNQKQRQLKRIISNSFITSKKTDEYLKLLFNFIQEFLVYDLSSIILAKNMTENTLTSDIIAIVNQLRNDTTIQFDNIPSAGLQLFEKVVISQDKFISFINMKNNNTTIRDATKISNDVKLDSILKFTPHIQKKNSRLLAEIEKGTVTITTENDTIMIIPANNQSSRKDEKLKNTFNILLIRYIYYVFLNNFIDHIVDVNNEGQKTSPKNKAISKFFVTISRIINMILSECEIKSPSS
jgi:hypothetical protein